MECSVSVLHSFEPARDIFDWSIGAHGISISFVHNKKRYHSTYLPYVAKQQSKTNIVSLLVFLSLYLLMTLGISTL